MDAIRVANNLQRVEARISGALARSGRAGPVTIVAVTKAHGPDAVRAAVAAGLRDCGENRVSELEAKRTALDAPVAWHLIGHLQRNKVRRALPLIDLLQSLDSQRLADMVSAEAVATGRIVPVLAQVNASGEATKGGFAADSAVDDIGRIATLPGLRLAGVMTMAPWTQDETLLRATFARVHTIAAECRRQVPGYTAEHVSMGMSNDFELAVEEGSTMVRLGTILFGERERQ